MYKTSTQKISLSELFAIFKRANIWEMELSYWTKPPKDNTVADIGAKGIGIYGMVSGIADLAGGKTSTLDKEHFKSVGSP